MQSPEQLPQGSSGNGALSSSLSSSWKTRLTSVLVAPQQSYLQLRVSKLQWLARDDNRHWKLDEKSLAVRELNRITERKLREKVHCRNRTFPLPWFWTQCHETWHQIKVGFQTFFLSCKFTALLLEIIYFCTEKYRVVMQVTVINKRSSLFSPKSVKWRCSKAVALLRVTRGSLFW